MLFNYNTNACLTNNLITSLQKRINLYAKWAQLTLVQANNVLDVLDGGSVTQFITYKQTTTTLNRRGLYNRRTRHLPHSLVRPHYRE